MIAASSTGTSSVGSATTTVALPLPPTPDQNFMEVSYSVDGMTWVQLGKIDLSDWQNFTVSVPVQNWSDLQKLQIKVSDIPTTLTQLPQVFLDGMFVEAQYVVSPSSASSTNAVSDSVGTVSAQPPVIVSVPNSNAPIPATGNSNFGSNDAPSFNFNLSALPAPPIMATDSAAVATSTVTSSSSPMVPVSSPSSTSVSTSDTFTSSSSSAPPLPAVLPPPSQGTSTNASSTTGLLYPVRHLLASAARFFLDILPIGKRAFAQNATPSLPTAQNPIVARILDANGNVTPLQPTFVVAGSDLRIVLPKPGRAFRPGAYSLELWVWQNGTVYYSESSFTWGVLAVNFDKSIYTLGNTVHMGFAVLTSEGDTVCDAPINMTVTSPSGKVSRFSTSGGTIIQSSTCGPRTVTDVPDYLATMPASEVGTYAVTVTAETGSGSRTLSDSFEVQAAPAFDVSRTAPTRIYPPDPYTVTIHIVANQNYTGPITETMPSSFQVVPQTFANRTFSGDAQTLSWNVTMKKGSVLDLSYSFLAPNISPEIYLLGPLTIGSWQEARQWQIAADASWYQNWGYRQPITINSSQVSSTLSNFPVAVVIASSSYLESTAYGGDVTNGNGADILFTAGDGTTKLNFQIENYASSTGNLVAWVNLPSVSATATTSFYLYYGNSTTTSQQNVAGTWDNNYQAVWHFPNGSTLSALDSTANANNGTVNGATATTGEIDGGASFNGSSDITTPYLQNQVVAYTIESWINTSDSSSIQPIVNDRGSGAGKSLTLFLEGNGACGNTSGCGGSAGVPSIGLDSNSIFIGLNGSTALTNGAWHQVVGTWAAASGTAVASSQFTLYVDGINIHAAAKTVAGSATSPLTGLGGAVIGYHQAWNHYFTGSMDEVRISTVARSASWVYTEYKNQSSPSTFYTVGAQETEPANNPTVTNVVLNNTNPIVLTPGTTTMVSVTASTTAGTNPLLYATSTIYRTGVGSNCVANDLNCYQIPSSSCMFSGASTTVTCSVPIWYFAQATDASSSYPTDSWSGTITVADSGGGIASGTSTGVTMNTLLAINVTPASISYGTLVPGANTGSTDQTTVVADVGNASSTLDLSGTAFTGSGGSMATSSQHYATSSFTFGGTESPLSDVPAAVSGFLLAAPTSTASVQGTTYWGDQVPSGFPTGTYTSTITFTGVFHS
jgi:hypothetical protein